MNGEHSDEPLDTSSDSSSHDAVEASPSGGDVPSSSSAFKGRVVVRIGAAIMVLASLLRWLDTGGDGFPHISGIGGTTFGVGLTVFVLGLSLLLRDWPFEVTLGKALGAISVTAVFVSMVGPNSGQLDAGPWVALVGAAVVAVGAILVAVESVKLAELELTGPLPAGLGAGLAIVAAFWLDWFFWSLWGFFLDSGLEQSDAIVGPINGLDPTAPFGIPVLIFASVAMLLIAGVIVESPINGKLVPRIIQISGISITVIAGANVLGSIIVGWFLFGSAPVVALAGGILVTSAVRESDS